MIPRKEAQKLLVEYAARLRGADLPEPSDVLIRDTDVLEDVAHDMLAESDLVLRGSENIEQKGRRYLSEGRITVDRAGDGTGWIVATARGGDGTYKLGYDPTKNQWRCTCRSGRKGRCSHLVALKLITTTTGGTT